MKDHFIEFGTVLSDWGCIEQTKVYVFIICTVELMFWTQLEDFFKLCILSLGPE